MKILSIAMKRKIFLFVIIIALGITLNIQSALPQQQPPDINTVYNTIDDLFRCCKWPPQDIQDLRNLIERFLKKPQEYWLAKILFDQLENTLATSQRIDDAVDFDRLKQRVSKKARHLLKKLYSEGKKELKKRHFIKAQTAFLKVLYMDPDYRDTRKLLEKAQRLRNDSIETIVSSKTPDKTETGIRIYKPKKCYNGYTLFWHAPLQFNDLLEIEFFPVYLIDMHGEVVHQWMNVGEPILCQLKPDGYLLCSNGQNLLELDAHSNPVWEYAGCIDHAFNFLENGKVIIERNPDCFVGDDFPAKPQIEIIGRDKKVLWNWKGKQHIKELEKFLNFKVLVEKDWDNANACRVLKDNPLAKLDRRFREGNILFCFNALDIIGIIDYPSGEIVWISNPNIFSAPHSPTMLDNGNLLVFDNGRVHGWSRVVELNPLTQRIVWEYHSQPQSDFFSASLSSAMRLSNGNTLICEGEGNRIFEITHEGEIVWDFISAFNRTEGTHTIYRAYRYSAEYIAPLLRMEEKNAD